MIVVDEGDRLLLITQPDHAHLAAQILSLCRFPGLVGSARRNSLLLATREHDNGWQELDAAPPVDADGTPYQFTYLPHDMRRELWTSACERFRTTDPYVALLITQHALALHTQWADDAPWAEWLELTNKIRDELLDDLPITSEALATDYALLRLADLCSLALCARSPNTFEHLGITAQLDGNTLRLDPLPLAGTTSFKLACRQIPKRAYVSTVDLGAELAAARWETRAVRIAGPSVG